MTYQWGRRETLATACLLIACLALPGLTLAAGQEPPALTRSLTLASKGGTLHTTDEWDEGQSQFVNAVELFRASAGQLTNRPASIPRLMVTTETTADHAAALRRVFDIASEAPAATTQFLAIGGWAGMQRRQIRPVEQPDAIPAPATRATYIRTTTAVAVGATVVRLEGFIPAGAIAFVETEVRAIGAGMAFTSQGEVDQTSQDVDHLRSTWQSRPSTPQPSSPEGVSSQGEAPPTELTSTELNIRVNNSTSHDSEIEVAVSTDGRHIVVGNNSRDWSYSNDGGKTWTSGGTLAQPAGFFAVNGDPSLSFGRSGAFYYAFIGYPDTNASAARDECSTAIDASTDNGQNFGFRGNAVYCNDSGTICFPDQEHIAADRFNSSAGGGDQVYSVW